MQIWNRQLPDKIPLFKPLLSIVLLALLSIGVFLAVSDYYVNILFDRVEKQYRQNLINIVSVARHSVEPVLKKVRSGEISCAEAIERIRPMIRAMTYEDRNGKNYVFMTSYNGTTLVQPLDPAQEMKNRLDLRDIKGVYILRELIKAAKTTPEGSFVRYHYPHYSHTKTIEEKLTYVVGLPEIECYIATGMYMEHAIQEQRETLAKMKYAAILLLVALLIPIFFAVFVILNKNKKLLAEVRTRMQVEEDLKKGEEKYRSIFENAIEGIFQTTPDGHLISVNPAFASCFGYESPRAMLDSGKPIDCYYADPGERQQLLRMINEKGVVEDYLVKMKRRDGDILWASLSTRVVRNNAGHVLYYEGTLEDVTDHKEQEEKFSKVFLTTPDCIAISRLADGRLMELNLGFEDITGWKRSEAVGQTSYDIDFWVETSERDLMEKDLKAGGDILHREFLFRRKDGSVRNGVYSARSIQIAGEACLIFVMQDITEHKQTEDALQKTASELQMIFKNMFNAFVIWESVFDEEGGFVSFRFGFFNDAFARISGLKREEVTGRDVFEVWPGTEPSWIEAYGKVALTGNPDTFDMYHAPTQGWYHCNAYRPTDSPAQVCVIFENITQANRRKRPFDRARSNSGAFSRPIQAASLC
ncbi:MAG: Methyl-accepting chemotaxis protein 4 [Syntrophus sp. PtaU1.Bin005]|nr:MAG: Methyl-accepting chemotaxis protein 4 [Syntrophus sp. PtaU1.Bin005]